MIGFLRGRISHIGDDMCFLDVSGVGYRVFASSATLSALEMGKEEMLFTHLAVREDAMLLYGFTTQEEYDVFQLLIAVSGIGPKAALGILSTLTVAQLVQAVQGKDVKRLTQAPGIGKKSAERLILELKDKLQGVANVAEADMTCGNMSAALTEHAGAQEEAMLALASFGYSREEITAYLKQVQEDVSTEDLIRCFLKQAAK